MWQGLGMDAAAGRKVTCMECSITDTFSDGEETCEVDLDWWPSEPIPKG